MAAGPWGRTLDSMALSDRQFTLFNKFTPAEGPDDHAQSRYSLARERGTGYADVHGQVSVTHHGSGPYSIQGWNQPRFGEDLKQPVRGQQRLFREEYRSETPGKSTVDLMSFTKESRSLAMPVLAAAQREAVSTYGRGLIPSTNRSEHSERLVQNMAGEGIIDASQRTQTNGMDFPAMASEEYAPNLGYPEEPSVLQRGKKDVRDLIKGRPGRKRKTDGTQEPLF